MSKYKHHSGKLADAFRLGEEWPDWWHQLHITNEVTTHNHADATNTKGPDYALINHPEGHLRAYRGDWIVRNEDGTVWPWSPTNFKDNFEEVK